MSVKTDIEIAREAKTKPIADVAAKIGIPAEALVPYGWTKAKVSFDYINKIQGNKDGKLILLQGAVSKNIEVYRFDGHSLTRDTDATLSMPGRPGAIATRYNR